MAAFFEPVKKVGKTGICRYTLDYLKHAVTTQFLLPFLLVLFLVFEIRVVGTPLRRSDPFKLVEPAFARWQPAEPISAPFQRFRQGEVVAAVYR